MYSGFKNILKYRYLKMESKTLNIDGMCEDLLNAPENSVVILHACGHNPTCVDPTKEQWKRIAGVIKVSVAKTFKCSTITFNTFIWFI